MSEKNSGTEMKFLEAKLIDFMFISQTYNYIGQQKNFFSVTQLNKIVSLANLGALISKIINDISFLLSRHVFLG